MVPSRQLINKGDYVHDFVCLMLMYSSGWMEFHAISPDICFKPPEMGMTSRKWDPRQFVLNRPWVSRYLQCLACS